MRNVLCTAALAALALCASVASAQTAVFDFQDNTDQGWGAGFGDDASETFPIANIGGSLRMEVLRNGGFQEAGFATGNPGLPFFQVMAAGAADEANVLVSYDWYIDTSAFTAGPGTFLQLATYINTGSGYYAQDFGAIKDVELTGDQLASGSIFSGTVTETLAAKGYNMPLGETFYRFGVIINGDGVAQKVHYDNVTFTVVPEPASMALALLGLPMLRRRR